MKRNVALVAMVLACLFIGTSAFAVVIGNPRPLPFAINPTSASSEPQLFAYVNNSGGSGILDGKADPTQLSYNYFTPNGSSTGQAFTEFSLEFRFAGNSNAISLYNLNDTSQTFQIFSGSDVANNNNGTINSNYSAAIVKFTKNISGNWTLTGSDENFTSIGTTNFNTADFGFLLNSNNNNFYGDDSLNGGEAHMLTFKGIGEYANNYWFAFEDRPSSSDRDFNDVVFTAQSIHPVPEPGTLLFLGSGLLGLALTSARKKFRK